jgi:hypothetical protein
MATPFYPNVTAAVEEYLTEVIEFTITTYNRWCSTSSKHAVTRTFTLRTIAGAVDTNLTGVDPAV